MKTKQVKRKEALERLYKSTYMNSKARFKGLSATEWIKSTKAHAEHLEALVRRDGGVI